MSTRKMKSISILLFVISLCRGTENPSDLFWAIELDDQACMAKLIEKGAVNAKDEDGDTALHLAARRKSLKAAEFLVQNGANVRAKNNREDTPLHLAAARNEKKISELLIQNGADREEKNKAGQTARQFEEEFDRKITSAPGKVKSTAHYSSRNIYKEEWIDRKQSGIEPLNLVTAVETWDKGSLSDLIGKSDFYAKDERGNTALHWAARENSAKAAQTLIKFGVGIEAKNEDGETPLHIAAFHNSDGVAQILLKSGADKNAKNEHGETPFHIAAAHDSDVVAQILIARGANVNAKNDRGQTPLEVAAARKELRKWRRFDSYNLMLEIIERGNTYATMNYPSGNVYTGYWLHGLSHGKGVFKWKSGDVYDGDFFHGKRDGKGTLTFFSGEVYEGGFVDNKKHGKGKFTNLDGTVIEGIWIDGKFVDQK